MSRAALSALDFGLRVRIEAHPPQRTIVPSSRTRAELDQVTSALMVNVQSGFWPLARRAATDLGGLLAYARKRRFADPELCIRGANCAFRIAELVAKEVR